MGKSFEFFSFFLCGLFEIADPFADEEKSRRRMQRGWGQVRAKAGEFLPAVLDQILAYQLAATRSHRQQDQLVETTF